MSTTTLKPFHERCAAASGAIVLAGLAAAWLFADQSDDERMPNRNRLRIVESVQPCTGRLADAAPSYAPGSVAAVRMPDDSVLQFEYVDDNGPDKRFGRLLTVTRQGSIQQVLQASGGDFSICDFNGDGQPDLFFVDGFGAHVVESSVLVYEPVAEKFLPLELDGSATALNRVLAKLGFDPREHTAGFSNAEVENIDGVLALRESIWGSSGGTIMCWIVSGRRLVFAAGLKFGYEEKPVAVWADAPASPTPKYKSVPLQVVYGHEYEQAVSGIECSELMADLEGAQGRAIDLRLPRLPQLRSHSEIAKS